MQIKINLSVLYLLYIYLYYKYIFIYICKYLNINICIKNNIVKVFKIIILFIIDNLVDRDQYY